MLPTILEFFLLFGQSKLIIPIILIGYIWSERKTFFHAANIVFLSVLLSYVLKSIFAVPLNPALGENGFSFPSSHMQAAFAFYGWLYLHLSNRLIRISIISILFIEAIALIYFGYHNIIDVLGGIFFAIILISFYRFFLALQSENMIFITIALFSSLLIFISHKFYHLEPYLLKTYYALLCLLATEIIFCKNLGNLSYTAKLIASIFWGLFIAAKISGYINLPAEVYANNINWAMMTIMLSLSAFISQKIAK